MTKKISEIELMEDRENDWLSQEIARERRISAWDIDEGKIIRQQHQEHCAADSIKTEHEENCAAETIKNISRQKTTEAVGPSSMPLVFVGLLFIIFFLIFIFNFIRFIY